MGGGSAVPGGVGINGGAGVGLEAGGMTCGKGGGVVAGLGFLPNMFTAVADLSIRFNAKAMGWKQ